MQRITLNSGRVNKDGLLIDAQETCEYLRVEMCSQNTIVHFPLIIKTVRFILSVSVKTLNAALPVLRDNLTQFEALSRMVPPSANLTESIWKIKEVIEETRNFVNRVKFAFNCASCFSSVSYDLKLL